MTESEIMKEFEELLKAAGENPLGIKFKYGFSIKFVIGKLQKQIAEKNAEIERLEKAILVQEFMLKNQDYKIKKARAEAIKEVFSEIENRIGVGHDILDFWDVFDELKKEMGCGE